ncbi:hypothetical protein ACFP2T_37580 [Plantactinospora solaniradicis]|uniref:ATP-binding protein n=1 Tax=Plantactinospora solaniradicis TaxID=1723736 RepID=A0ABW1KJG6_9ACTN
MTTPSVDRHVQHANDEDIPLDREGFLDLDGTTGIILVRDLAGSSESFVLLASGGVGKSTVLKELRAYEDGCVVDLRDREKAEIGQVVAEAVATGRPIYLDALDEAVPGESGLFRVLGREMSRPEAQSVRWRLACRPAAWNGAALPPITKLRLLPLTRDAARQLLASIKVEEDFLDAIITTGPSRLSGSLLHFVAAAKRWQEQRRLPARRVDALEYEVARLLAEREDERPPLRVPADLRRRAAGRLAAITVFCGAGRLAFRTDPASSILAISDLPSRPEPDRPDATIGREVYEEVVASALFDAVSDKTVAFRHQEYADYLAARYVTDRSPVRAQLAVLLGLADGVLPQAMSSIAAWLVALRPDLTDMLMPANALALAESEVDLPPAAREAVVTALLSNAQAANIRPERGLDLSALVHPDLERQLSEHVATGMQHPAEVWWVCRLALAGQVTTIASEALAMALNPRWLPWARRTAIAVVTELGTDVERSALRSRLELDEQADPDDELRAGLLDGLYPQALATTELLALLTPPRNPRFIGHYQKFLEDFVGRVPAIDLPEVLAWAVAAVAGTVSTDRHFDRLAVRTVERAFAFSDDLAVGDALAEALIRLVFRLRRPWPWAQDDVRRRRVAIAVAERLDEPQWYLLIRTGLITESDIAWLLDQAASPLTKAQDVLVKCLHQLNAKAAATPEEPNDDEEDQEESDADGEAHEQLKTTISRAQDDVTAWWLVSLALATTGSSWCSCDLTERPGWSLLDEDDRKEVLDLGLRYVLTHKPAPDEWLGKAKVTRAVLRDWSGTYLLTTLAKHDPGRLGAVPSAVWSTWAPVIAGAWAHDRRELLKTLVALAPASARAAILETLRRVLELREEWSPSPLYEVFLPELVPVLMEHLRQRRYADDQNVSVLNFLVEHAPASATEACRDLAVDDGSMLAREARRHLAAVEPEALVDQLTEHVADRGTLLARVQGLDPERLDDGRLARLARLLFDRFPFDSDPPLTSYWGDSPEHDTARLRNVTVQLLSMRGLVTDLTLLATSRSPIEREFIGEHLRRARQVVADSTLARPMPAQLLDLLGRSDVRLIRGAGDLLQVVQDHLGELQHYLSRTGGFRELWSSDGKKPASEDDVSDWVRRRFMERLGGGSLIDREIQVERRKIAGVGTRIDLTVSASTATAPVAAARVVVEAKLVGNRELLTGLQDQLVQRYLEADGLQHGVFLVYWVRCDQRPTKWSKVHPSKERLVDELQQLADVVAPRYQVRPFVLDISWPT